MSGLPGSPSLADMGKQFAAERNNVEGQQTGTVGLPPAQQHLAASGYQTYAPPPAPTLNPQSLDPNYLAALKARFQNQGPSYAETLLNQGSAENQARIAATAGVRGAGLPGLAQRDAATAMATSGVNTAAQAAQLKAQEAQGNQAALGGALSTNAQLGEMNNQQQQAQYQFMTNLAAQEQANKNAALTGYENVELGQNFQTGQNTINGITQGASSVLGALATLSDETEKKNIRPGHIDARKFMDALKAHSYNYKPGSGEDPGPRHLGVMAQDMEKAAPGAVENTPQGKAIDYGQLAGTFAASLSDLHERMKALEGKKGKK